jgi:AbiU2
VLIIVSRFFDPPRKTDENLAQAFKLLRDAATRTEVSVSGSATELLNAENLFNTASVDPRLTTLRHTRHKELAHLAARDPSIPKPLIDDLFRFTREACDVCEKLALGTGVMLVELASHVHFHKESAAAFWAPWAPPPS